MTSELKTYLVADISLPNERFFNAESAGISGLDIAVPSFCRNRGPAWHFLRQVLKEATSGGWGFFVIHGESYRDKNRMAAKRMEQNFWRDALGEDFYKSSVIPEESYVWKSPGGNLCGVARIAETASLDQFDAAFSSGRYFCCAGPTADGESKRIAEAVPEPDLRVDYPGVARIHRALIRKLNFIGMLTLGRFDDEEYSVISLGNPATISHLAQVARSTPLSLM